MSNVPAQRRPSPATVREQLHGAAVVLQQELERQVHAQRLAHASWSAIGRWLGVSRQAASKRWSYVDDFGPPVLVMGPDAHFLHPATGAAVGREQLLQVRAGGIVTTHHSVMSREPARCMKPAPGTPMPLQAGSARSHEIAGSPTPATSG